MNQGRTIFAQVMDGFSHKDFQACVTRYNGDWRTRHFSCHDLFATLAFAQLTFRESLRDIEACLLAFRPRLYHMGLRGRVSRSTLSDALERRDWRILRDYFATLVLRAQKLCAGDALPLELGHPLYALDTTVIDLCLALFPHAPFRKGKAAIKLHTLIDLRGPVPLFIHVSHGLLHDVHGLDLIETIPGAIYLIDRAYVDYHRLFRLHQQGAFFVTRAKKNSHLKRQRSRPVDRESSGVLADQLCSIGTFYARKGYPKPIRRVTYRDRETGRRYVFLTNNRTLSAETIAALYRQRWQIELFFRWIKQHLRIKAFYGRSENAVKCQVYSAACVYLLVLIMKKTMRLEVEMHTLMQVLSLTLFEKMPINEALEGHLHRKPVSPLSGQLTLF